MLWIGLVLFFFAMSLFVIGASDWVAVRLAERRGIYEQIVGKELYRLFLKISPQEFIIIHLGVIVAGIMLGSFLLWEPISGGFIGGLIGFFLPRFWLMKEWKKRLEVIDEQVEESMVYMANSFKANPSLPEAIQDVVNAMGPPIGEELTVLLREYQLGTPMDQALINLRQRVPARNLELAISALVIGRTVGGNIPVILEEIAGTVRESYRLERFVDKQTAQGKMQAWVMGLMPGAVLGIFYLMEPDLIIPLFENIWGYLILTIAAVLNIIGVAMILKIVNIDI